MLDEVSTAPLVIRLATSADIAHIEMLDSFSDSPTRDIHRQVEKYFGSVDPSTHESTLIFLAEVAGTVAAKAELMLPSASSQNSIGYIKRVVVHPSFRQRRLARHLMEHIITLAHTELNLTSIDLHVWEDNVAAIQLYESLNFQLQHRELYFRLPL